MEEPKPINFTWFYFIGRKKLGLTFRETGRLTLKLFNKLYQCYKDDFDHEMYMQKTGYTYAGLEAKAQKSEEWF